MKLSVLLPCFNGAETIGVQLEALTVQEWHGGWEVIVVNNGSTDSSMQIVEQYRERLPGLKIVQAHVPGTPRLGVPHSYNTGIKSAGGEAFVFCEADDEVAPGWLAAMGNALAEHEFVVARLDHKKLNADWLHPHDYQGEGYQSAGLTGRQRYPYLLAASGCGFGLRRSLYEKIGPLSNTFSIVADAEYCWRAQLAGYKLHFEPKALIHYRERSGLKARFRQGRNWGRDFTRLLQHYGEPQKRFASLRQLIWIARCLPTGLWAFICWVLRLQRGRVLLPEWVWNFGWSSGKLLATLDPLPPDPAVVVPEALRQHQASGQKARQGAHSRWARLKGLAGKSALSFTLASPEMVLADDKRLHGAPERRIDVHQEYDLRDWALSLGVSPEKLKEAVQAVGDRAQLVQEHLARTGNSFRR